MLHFDNKYQGMAEMVDQTKVCIRVLTEREKKSKVQFQVPQCTEILFFQPSVVCSKKRGYFQSKRFQKRSLKSGRLQ